MFYCDDHLKFWEQNDISSSIYPYLVVIIVNKILIYLLMKFYMTG